MDNYTRECPAIEVGSGICIRRVTRTLERVMEGLGKPKSLRCNNGPEFSSRHFVAWCEEQGIVLNHIQPGKPTQNGHMESFNGRLRDERLNASWFLNTADVKRKIESWLEEYKAERSQQPGVPDSGGVRESLLRTHQQDGLEISTMITGFPNCGW